MLGWNDKNQRLYIEKMSLLARCGKQGVGFIIVRSLYIIDSNIHSLSISCFRRNLLTALACFGRISLLMVMVYVPINTMVLSRKRLLCCSKRLDPDATLKYAVHKPDSGITQQFYNQVKPVMEQVKTSNRK